MMGKLRFNIYLNKKHYQNAPLNWINGTGFFDGRILNSESLKFIFQTKDTNKWNSISKILSNMNGFFALVIVSGQGLLAAVDHIRSIPLFYSIKYDKLFLSDDPYWIQKQFGGEHYDELSIADFLFTGYVTGSSTLDSRIYQLLPGEYLTAESQKISIKFKIERYYRYTHHDYFEMNLDDLKKRLHQVTLTAIKRLITVAEGRPILIPLSGGLDSRLIVLMLKNLKYKNLIAFSYGVPGNSEANISKMIASELGIEWHFVEYSEEMWKSLYLKDQFKDYIHFAEKLVSVVHIQDWPAIMKLRKSGIITDDTIIVPGHSADFVAGSHIPKELLKLKMFEHQEILGAIWKDHYVLNSSKDVSLILEKNYDNKNQLLQRISKTLTGLKIRDIEELLDAYEFWDWQERQSKFINNSVRVYEFWNCQWWLPFWDREYLAFWERVPIELRIGKKLYNEYVELVQGSFNIDVDQNLNTLITHLTKQILEYFGVWEKARNLFLNLAKRSIIPNREFKNHPLAWYGIVSNKRMKNFVRNNSHVNAILAIDQIQTKLGKLDENC